MWRSCDQPWSGLKGLLAYSCSFVFLLFLCETRETRAHLFSDNHKKIVSSGVNYTQSLPHELVLIGPGTFVNLLMCLTLSWHQMRSQWYYYLCSTHFQSSRGMIPDLYLPKEQHSRFRFSGLSPLWYVTSCSQTFGHAPCSQPCTALSTEVKIIMSFNLLGDIFTRTQRIYAVPPSLLVTGAS